jgi:recombination associated protein RdgC
MKELKDEVRDELLPRAFTLSADTRVWIDPVAGRLAIDTVSAARADEAIGLLIRAVDGLAPRPLKTAASPAGEMTAWLATGQPPAGFTIDQDAELRARDGKATVRFANQSLDREDIARHTGAGKQCTKLALTWEQRVAFVLTDRLEIRRIRPQDVLREEAGSAEGDAAERLTADMTLMTGELARLLDDVTEALGGPQPT